MNIRHEFYKLDIETKNSKYKKINRKLKGLYGQLPASKCLFCPGKCSVEADCCKVFSPPMLLVEFLNAIETINEWDKEKQRTLLFSCLDSFIIIESVKPCILLEKNLCSIYGARPLSCRLFSMYPDEEWEKRLNIISKDSNVNKEDLPFFKQCRNVEIDGNEKTVPTKKSDAIFKKLYKLDIELFQNKEIGTKIVLNDSSTYMPFEAHYICYKLGAHIIQVLTDMKLMIRKLKENKESGSLEYIKLEKNLKEFVGVLKNSLVLNNVL